MNKKSLAIVFSFSLMFVFVLALNASADEISTSTQATSSVEQSTASSTLIVPKMIEVWVCSSTQPFASSTIISKPTDVSLCSTTTVDESLIIATTTFTSLKYAISAYNAEIKAGKAVLKKATDKALAVYNAILKSLKKELAMAKRIGNRYAVIGANKYYKEQSGIAKNSMNSSKKSANDSYNAFKKAAAERLTSMRLYWRNPKPVLLSIATTTPEIISTSTPEVIATSTATSTNVSN